MSAYLLRGILTCFGSGWLLCFGWFVAAGTLLPHAPNPIAVDDREFVCRPTESVYHLPGCRYVNESQPVLRLDGRRMADSSGRTPCPHCLKNAPTLPTHTAQESPQQPRPAGSLAGQE